MNTKGSKGIIGITLAFIMIASIFAAINPVPVSARVITVDGDSASYAGEWDTNLWPTGDKANAVSDPANDPDGIGGYDLKDLYIHYDSPNDTMYFRVDVYGIPADLDENGDIDTVCSVPPGDCTGVGAFEQYTLVLNSPGFGTTQMVYSNNALSVTPSGSGSSDYGSGTGNDCIEFSLNSASTLLNPIDFCINVTAGGSADLPGEDTMSVCLFSEEKEPPEFNFTWDVICCRNLSFTGWSSDPTNISNHTWDFGDGSPTETYSGAPATVTHQYTSCNPPFGYTVTLSGYCTQGLHNSTWDIVWPNCDPTVIVRATPTCFEGTGELITFNGSDSYADDTANPGNTITWWNWTFSDGLSGSSDDTAVTSRTVNDNVKATLEVSDGHCNNTGNVTVGPCSLCNIRLYGTYGEGAGNLLAIDPYTNLAPENKPYTDPVGPFFPQHEQAPRKDFITFNPAIMDDNDGYPELHYIQCGPYTVQTPAEKVFKRMWYEKEWFKDYIGAETPGEWDVVMVDGTTVKTLSEWMAMDKWARPTIREWNSPNAPDWNKNADIYGPAINQEFTYMTLNQDWEPIFVQNASMMLIPMASYEQGNGLDSFDADGDGKRDAVRVESEETLGIDIDQDNVLEPMDGDIDELSGNETVVLALGPKKIFRSGYGAETKLQFFDHVVEISSVDEVDGEYTVWLRVTDNEGDPYWTEETFVPLKMGEVARFYRGLNPAAGEKPAFYVRLSSTPDYAGQYAWLEVGRMFGQTYANIEYNEYRAQKMFIVDQVFYNAVAIKAQDNCFKYITFRQKLPKTPIKIFGKELKVWTVDPETGKSEVLPEMSPFNLDHKVIVDVWAIDPTAPPYPIDKIGPKEERPPLEIIYVDETEELRYKGELKEIYAEEHDSSLDEFWTLEWYWTLPWQYTEFRLPKGDKYLVTLSWRAEEAETTLWDGGDETNPVWNKTTDRFKFWYEDCSGPLYIDRANSSIRLYGTFGEGAGNQDATDVEPGDSFGMYPENKPYTDPEGPFFPQHDQAPVKDFMTFNPAIMDHNQGYPELHFVECPNYVVQTPKEKVFKRMWYEKEWFKDYIGAETDGEWDVVVEQYNDAIGVEKWELYAVMTLAEWNAIPDYEKIINMLRLRQHNSPETPDWNSNADIYGPAINQEFTYMTVNQDTMPIMVRAGSKILIPLAHYDGTPYRGLNSFDADGDGARDAVRVESEDTLSMDIDGDGIQEEMNEDSTELNGDEQVVLVLGPKKLDKSTTLQFFDYVVELDSVGVTGGDYNVWFNVRDNWNMNPAYAVGPMRYKDVVYLSSPASGSKPAFYLKLLSADHDSQTARIEVGRMFGQTHANIEFNQYRDQKMFIVDGVFYNVVAVKADNNCFKYITIRQKLPKDTIKIFGFELKTWTEGETLPELTPFNEWHEILVDVQSGWGAIPHTQQAKIGPKVPVEPLNITYVDEDEEWRFLGELKEIYNESYNASAVPPVEEEYWNVEWFHTKPMQYTAFVMPEGQGLYLMTLAWYAPEAEITIWDHNPEGPSYHGTDSRVKFWYDPADNTDIYINRVGDIPEEAVTIADWYNMASHDGDGIPWISSDEVINAVMDYLQDAGPFAPGSDPHFIKDDLLNYILDYLSQP